MATTKNKKRRRSPSLRGLSQVTPGSGAAERLDNIKVDAIRYGLIAAGGTLAVVGLVLAKKSIQNSLDESKHEEAATQVSVLNTAPYYADRLRAAFNPSGFESLRRVDTTDVTGVLNVARALKAQDQLVLVAVAYRTLTSRRLMDDMREELSGQEYQQFWQIISQKPKK